MDRSYQPMILLIEEGDRVWWSWDKLKVTQHSLILVPNGLLLCLQLQNVSLYSYQKYKHMKIIKRNLLDTRVNMLSLVF